MTLRLINVRKWLTEASAALLLGGVMLTPGTRSEASQYPSQSVYPRAGVSSDAYRTPPQLLAHVSARPITVRRGQSPDTPAARRTRMIDPRVVQVDHNQVQQASRSGSGQSVQAELRRLYAEDGREMPQMAMPTSRPRPAQHSQPNATGNQSHAAPPVHAQPERESSGLLAGLFDFGRSRRSRSSSQVMQPPAEPAPFTPPTYRQKQAGRRQPAQAQSQQPAARQKAATQQQQTTARSTQSNSVVELKRATPQRKQTAEVSEFFPKDASLSSQQTARQPDVLTNENLDDMAEFFPNDIESPAESETSPAVASAANSAKQKMQQMFEEKSQATADAFQMPVATRESITPSPAPAAVSEAVTTNVGDVATQTLTEPAPFFADDERAIDANEQLEIAEVTGETFDPSGADSEATAGVVADAGTSGSKMQQIAARDGVGLKGYCPVALRDERRLADGKAAYVSYYQGKAYYFFSAQAKDTFDVAPARYAPASAGEDLIMKTLTGEVVEGSLDHSVWYRGRLYLFHSAENLKTFMAAPSAMAVSN